MAEPSVTVRPYCDADREAVIALWRRCGLVVPWNDPARDIDRKLRVNPEWFLVGEAGGEVIATLMAGYEGHRGWLNYLAVDPQQQRQGLGRLMVARADELLRGAGCPKINLQVRRSNVAAVGFYEALGFRADDVLSLGKRLEKDE